MSDQGKKRKTRQEQIDDAIGAADGSLQERDIPKPKAKNPNVHGTPAWHRWEDKHKDD